MKTLKALQNDGLLKSKSYGLGVEMLWCLKKHRIIAELGLDYPRFVIHRFKYEHEKACGDVFVSLALTGQLYEWEGEGDQRSGFRHDRKFSLAGSPWYLEHEEGNQAAKVLRAKLDRYVALHAQHHEPFGVLFTVKDGETFRLVQGLFSYLHLPSMYCVTLHGDFVSDPLNTSVTSRIQEQPFINHSSNHTATESPDMI